MKKLNQLFFLYNKIYKTLNLNLKKRVVYLQIINIFAGIADIAGVVSVAPLVAIISNKDLIVSNIYIKKFSHYFNIYDYNNLIIIFSIIAGLIYIFSIIIKITQKYKNLQFSNDLYLYYSSNIFNYFLNKEYLFHKQASTSELISKTHTDAQRFQSQIIMSGLELISNIILTSLLLISLLLINFNITLLILFIFLLFYSIYFFLLNKALKRSGMLISITSPKFFQSLWEGFRSIKEAIIFDKLLFLKKNFDNSNKLISEENFKINFYSNLPRQIIELVSFLIIIMLLCILITILNYSFENLIILLSIYALCLVKILPSIQKIYLNLVAISTHMYAFHRIEQYLDLNKTSSSADYYKETAQVNNGFITFENEIILKNVNFFYSNKNNGIKNINLKIKKNQKVCIIGKSGSGKTTLVDILLGLIIPQSGNFLIDNTTINKNNLKDWYKKISFVSQDIYISDSSIKENIAFGESLENINENKIKEILSNLDLGEFSTNLNKNLGEMGSKISGGQKQRISLARALYKNSDVLFIDEGTSALDKETSDIITKYVFDLYRFKTIILIAHSKELFSRCEIYFEIDNGEITNHGLVKNVVDFNNLKSLN
jgi:ABC-type multidrug transport system fused ATPase/permease subunit